MDKQLQEVYDADVAREPGARGQRTTPRLGNVDSAEFSDSPRRRRGETLYDALADEIVGSGGGAVIDPRKHKWDDAYPPERTTPMEAYADGWMAYCQGDDEDPFGSTDLELSVAWSDGWADAEDFFGGEPCEDFIGDEPCQ